MTIRSRTAGRHEDGRTIQTIWGDRLPWKYDRENDVYWIELDGVNYVVARPHRRGADSKGHPLYRYWSARVRLNGEIVNLGDEYMNAWEAKEVCQIYESARVETKQLNNTLTLEASEKIDDARGQSEGEHSPGIGRVRGLLPHAGSDGSGSGGS